MNLQGGVSVHYIFPADGISIFNVPVILLKFFRCILKINSIQSNSITSVDSYLVYRFRIIKTVCIFNYIFWFKFVIFIYKVLFTIQDQGFVETDLVKLKICH